LGNEDWINSPFFLELGSTPEAKEPECCSNGAQANKNAKNPEVMSMCECLEHR
jgi:hypothetical protein